MKHCLLFAFLAAAACAIAPAASADEITYDYEGFTFAIDTEAHSAALVDANAPFILNGTVTTPDFVDYNGDIIPCTEIRKMAVSGFADITTVVLGVNVERVEDRPFYNCSALHTIMFNDKLTDIVDGLVAKCPALTTVSIPEGNDRFIFADGILYNADRSTIYAVVPSAVGATFTVPTGVKTLGAWSLSGQTQMKDVVLTEGLEVLGNGCLAETGIGQLNLPASMRDLGDGVCQDGYIGSITVAAGNPYMKVDADGYLLSTDGTICFASIRRQGACVVPDGVVTIRGGLCKRMNITSLTLPSSVACIGPEAFERTPMLASVEFGDGLREIGERAFWSSSQLNSVVLPAGVEVIGNEAFRQCQGIMTLSLGESLVELGDYAFAECPMIVNVDIPSTVTSWGKGAFMFDMMLSKVTIGEGVERVGHEAFTQCYSLQSVSLPSTMRVIGDFAFSKCMSLADINIPAGITHLGAYSFQDVPCAAGPLDLPCIEEIGENALARVSNVTALTCGPSLRTIGATGINGNVKMTSVTFSEGLRSIGFAGLGNLPITEMVLPATVEEVGYLLFGSENLHLESLTCLAPVPPSFIGDDTYGEELFGASALDRYQSVVLRVPYESLDAYKAHPIWGKFAVIVADPESGIQAPTVPASRAVKAIYDIHGTRHAAPVEGVNIIIYTDGSVAKIAL